MCCSFHHCTVYLRLSSWHVNPPSVSISSWASWRLGCMRRQAAHCIPYVHSDQSHFFPNFQDFVGRYGWPCWFYRDGWMYKNVRTQPGEDSSCTLSSGLSSFRLTGLKMSIWEKYLTEKFMSACEFNTALQCEILHVEAGVRWLRPKQS